MENRPVYCTSCGSIVDTGDRFCGVCGTGISPDATDAGPTREIPTIVPPPVQSGSVSASRPGSGASNTGTIIAIVGGIAAIILVLVVVGVILAVNLLGPDRSDSQQANIPPSSETPSTPPETNEETVAPVGENPSSNTDEDDTGSDTALEVGETADVQGIVTTLNEIRTLPETEMDQPLNSDSEFVAVDLTFDNTTEEPVSFSSLIEFVLKDEDGYSASQTIHTGQRQLSDGTLAAGQKSSGEIVYEVPTDADGLQLDYTPFAGMETYTWLIGDADDLSGPAGSASGVEPDDVTASGTSPSAPDASGNTISYEADNAVDGQVDTAWNVDGSGVGESITLEYDEPVTVSEIGLIPGYDKIDSADGTYRFFQLYVIERAEIEFSDGTSVEIDFDRDPFMQYIEFPDVETDSIEITILDSYPPGDSPYGETYPYTLEKAAISEIEVLGP